MYLDDCVCVLPDLTWLPLLGVGRKSWYIIIIIIFLLLIIINSVFKCKVTMPNVNNLSVLSDTFFANPFIRHHYFESGVRFNKNPNIIWIITIFFLYSPANSCKKYFKIKPEHIPHFLCVFSLQTSRSNALSLRTASEAIAILTL